MALGGERQILFLIDAEQLCDGCINLFKENRCQQVVSAVRMGSTHPKYVEEVNTSSYTT